MELLLILTFLAFFLLVFVLLIVLYKLLLKRGFLKLAMMIPAIILVVVGYGAYISLVPPDNFYKEDFEKYSGVPFPSSGEIVRKNATYPDLQGEYKSVALIRLSASDFDSLRIEYEQGGHSVVDTIAYPFLKTTSQFIRDSTQGENKNFTIVYKINILQKSCIVGFYKNGHYILFEKAI